VTALALGAACLNHGAFPGIEAHAQAAPEDAVRTADDAAHAVARRPWMNRSLSPEERAKLLIAAMNLDDKIALMHGVTASKKKPANAYDFAPPPVGYAGYVPPNPRLGIPALTLADGRAGVGNGAKNVTLLPAPIAAASSWDPVLLNEFGRVLGNEEWGKGTNVALSPTIDVVRVPEWGRTFESYGEDPYFNGVMAAAEIQGIQSEGPIANANMYLTMNQESDRFHEDSAVDERTMEEIYLPPYAAAVRQGHVGTVMCAYVRTNGIYSCENAQILQDFLRRQLGFHGWVMSDWGATHSTVDAANHGLDQQMPDGTYFGAALKAAVLAHKVNPKEIDEHVLHILLPMFTFGLFDKPPGGTWTSNVRSRQHDEFSRHVAEQGTILLKNEGDILPLREGRSIAVIGEAGKDKPKAEGGGSSGVTAPYVVSPWAGITRRAGAGSNMSYDDGSDPAKAAQLASHAQIAIVVVNTNETEGSDRPNLELPGNQDQLIEAVAQANKRTVVVLDTGGPVLMPWVDHVAAIIEAWYPGQEDGNALAAILFGDVNPSARLPLTFPRTADAIPTAQKKQWPGVDGHSIYTEKLDVGFRWYDATETKPLFPFGFGLSYTTFRLGDLSIQRDRFTTDELVNGATASITVHVTNTGARDGAEVVQLYVANPPANGEPPHQLFAFAKVRLSHGETQSVKLSLDRRAFSVYDPADRRWEIKPGTYGILVGTSSRNLPLKGTITIQE
jgi:beta-glucosidase